jgi:hypothetical protein
MRKSSLAHHAGLLALAGCCSAALLLGCSSNPSSDPAEVKGTVTYDGKPVVHGAVEFYKGGTKTWVAALEKNGSYQTALLSGEFKVAIVTRIEPRELARLVKEGTHDMVGAVGGKMPERPPTDAKPVRTDPYANLPSLASLLEKLSAEERGTLEAVQKRYADPASSGLTATISAGSNTQDFDLK